MQLHPSTPSRTFFRRALPGLGLLLGLLAGAAAMAQESGQRIYDLPAGSAEKTLKLFPEQSSRGLLVNTEATKGIRTNAVQGALTARDALNRMLAGTGLVASEDEKNGSFVVHPESGGPKDQGAALTPPRDRPASRSPTSDPGSSTLPAPAKGALENEEATVLSPFVVSTVQEKGYLGEASIAGGRLATALKDTPSSITVLTRQFIDELGLVNLEQAGDFVPNSVSQSSYAGPNQFNDYNVNFRSLGISFQARNYFKWYVNADTYNLERFDFARGPNSLVFGDAGVGGLGNSTTKRAKFANQSGALETTVSGFGGTRAVLDVNSPITKNWSVRLNGLYDRYQGWRDYETNDRNGLFATTSLKLGAKTLVTAEYEWGRSDRVFGDQVREQWTSWDKSTYVTAPLTAVPAAATGLSRITADTLTFDPGSPSLGVFNLLNFGSTNGTVRQPLPFAQYGLTAGDNVLIGTTTYALRDTITTPREYHFRAPNAVAGNPFYAYSAFLNTQFGDNLFAEVAYNHQHQERRVDNIIWQSIQIDVNKILPNGASNPHAGERVASAVANHTKQTNDGDEVRAALAYLLKFTFTDQRLLAGMSMRTDVFTNEGFGYRRTNGPVANVINAVNQVRIRRYESERSLDWAPPPESSNGYQIRRVTTGSSASGTFLTSYQVAAAGSWFKDRKLKTVFGIRRDVLNRDNSGTAVADPITGEILTRGPMVDVPEVTQDSRTAGVVYEMTKWGSLFANYAENYTPTGNAFRIDGGLHDPQIGEGLEGGLKLRLFDGRITGTATYYKNEQLNSRLGGAATDINEIWTDLRSSNLVTSGYQDTFAQKGTGWEFELGGQLLPGWSIVANYAVPDAVQIEGRDDTRAYYSANVQAWRTGANALTDLAARTRILQNITDIENLLGSFAEGRRLNNSYDYTANLFTSYRFMKGRLKGLSLGVGGNWRGARLVTNNPANVYDYVMSPSTETLLANASYAFNFGRMKARFQVNITNLLDKEIILPLTYSTYTVGGSAQFLPQSWNFLPPREVRFTAKFEY